jgi:hypothetical protein
VAAAGCGGGGDRDAPKTPKLPKPPKPNAVTREEARARVKRNIIVFRRVRYEGATLRTLYLHPDGTMNVDVPGGGAGGSKFVGRVKPAVLAAIKRDIARTPWRALSRRRVTYNRSGAYFMLRHDGREHIAMARHLSPDLVPIIDRLNAVLNGEGRSEYHVVHRFNSV